MTKRIAIILGHPDPAGGHFGHALAQAYGEGARQAGHAVKTIDVARLALPFLRNAQEWESGSPPEPVQGAQRDIAWAEHLLIVFPLWLGDMPAMLKAFFEHALRPGFAIAKGARSPLSGKLLKGRSARLVVTMGMPAFFYRAYYRAHSVKSLERNVLAFCGVAPVRTTLIGTVEGSKATRTKWLAKLAALGKKAD